MTGSTLAVSQPLDSTRLRAGIGRLLPWLASLLTMGVGIFAVDGSPVGAARDDSMYVVLAKSLATGHGFRWLHIPGAPVATHFPPGYPAVLALLWKLDPVFPDNVALFKLTNVLFAALAAFAVARLVRHRLDATELSAQVYALATMIAVPMLTLATQVMSEPLFLALTVGALIVAERVAERSDAPVRDVVVLALLSSAAALVRTHGMALVAAVALVLCIRRRFRDAVLYGCIALALLLPWQLWVALHAGLVPEAMRGNYGSYLSLVVDAVRARGLGFLGAAALRTSHDIGLIVQYAFAPVGFAALRITALAVLAVLTGVGTRSLWRRMPVTLAFVVIYLAIVLVWPYTPGRFVWCVWPLLILPPLAGVRDVVAWTPATSWARRTRLGLLAASAAMACGYVDYNVAGYRTRSWSTAGYATYMFPLLLKVVTRTPHNASIASEAEGTVYLYTGREAVPVGSFMATDYLHPRPATEYASAAATVLDRYHPAAIFVTTGFLRNAMRDLALARPPRLAVVDSFPGGGLVLVPTAP